MLRRLLLFGALITVVSWPAVTSAHELEANNGVSVVLHILPEDNPVAQDRTVMDLTFSSKSGGFDVASCDCSLSIQRDGQASQTAKISGRSGSATVGRAIITFPAAGVYDLTINGLTGQGDGDRFRLTFPTRVTSDTAINGSGSPAAKGLQVIMLSVTGLVLLGFMASEIIRRGGRYSAR